MGAVALFAFDLEAANLLKASSSLFKLGEGRK
jgi:hypothetical protein